MQRFGVTGPSLESVLPGSAIALFRQLFEHGLEAALLVGPAGDFLAANSAACALFGIGEAALCARSIAGSEALFADPSDPRLIGWLADRQATGLARGSVRLRRTDDEPFEADVACFPFLNERGEATSVLSLRDVSGLRLAERLARESEERLGFALDAADIGDWDMDLRTNVARRSLRHDRCFGYAELLPEWGYDTFLAHVDAQDRDRVDQCYQQAMRLNGDYDVEFRVTWPDGSVHWLWSKGRFYFDDRGKPYRVAGIQVDITSRRQMQEQLQRSERDLAITLERLELASRMAKVGGWELDVATMRPYWSPETCRIHEIDPPVTPPLDRAIGFYAPEAVPTILAAVQSAIDHGTPWDMELPLITAKGRPIWVRTQCSCVIEGGKVVRLRGAFHDITERKLAEAALRDSEDLKASVLDSLNAHIAVLDQQGVIISVNDAWRRFARGNGAPADLVDPVGQSYLLGCASAKGAAQDDNGADPLAGVFAVLAGQQTEYQAEYPCHTPFEQRWFRVSVTPLKRAQGGVVVSHVPVTELHMAAQTVLAAKAELQATLEAVPDLLFEIDLEERVQNFHSPRRELLYVPPEVFMGRTLSEFLPPAVVDVIRQALDQVQEIGFSTGVQYELALPDGAHWFELSAARRPMPAGQPARFIVLARDISDRKRAESERQLLERQLREAQKMESIGTLAGGIAHDFNNVLASILGNVALARADEDAGLPVRASLDQIYRAGLRARLLVQQILTFSRRDHGVFSHQPMVSVLEETFALLKATLPAGVRLDAVLPPSSLAVWGDATQLQQVLMNLCTNAWHALPESGGRIEVGAEALALDESQCRLMPTLKPGPLVHLWVSDNGSGMDEATRGRIFDPFFTTKPVGLGTGLGLSVVHGIVRAHGGALTVDSAPGDGTTFHLYFPVPEAPDVQAAAAPAPAALAYGTGQRVLYIDDDEVMALMVERLLLRAGFQVQVQTDAVAAVALLRAHPQDFDTVVTDYNMPVMSGLEVVRQVMLIRPGLPVVLSSGYLPVSLRAEALAAGALALLQKENTFEDLARVLQQVLAEGAAA